MGILNSIVNYFVDEVNAAEQRRIQSYRRALKSEKEASTPRRDTAKEWIVVFNGAKKYWFQDTNFSRDPKIYGTTHNNSAFLLHGQLSLGLQSYYESRGAAEAAARNSNLFNNTDRFAACPLIY